MTPAWEACAADWLRWAGSSLFEGSVIATGMLLAWWLVRGRAPARLTHALFVLLLLRIAAPISLPMPAWLVSLNPTQWAAAWLAGTPNAASAAAAPALRSASTALLDGPALATPWWHPWLFGTWLCTAALLAVWRLRARLHVARLIRRARPLPPAPGLDLEPLRATMRVRRAVRLLVSDELDTPAAGGLRRPYVVLPRGLAESLTPSSLRWVLLHELAHIRRGDLWTAALQDVIGTLLFFHPGVWLANRLIDEQREFAADEAARVASGLSRRACGSGFLSVVEWARAHQKDARPVLAMFRHQRVIRRRLMRLLQDRPPKTRSTLAGFVFAGLGALLLMPSAHAGQQDPEGNRLEQLEAKIRQLEAEQRELRSQLRALKQEAPPSVKSIERRRTSAPTPRVLRTAEIVGTELPVEEEFPVEVIEIGPESFEVFETEPIVVEEAFEVVEIEPIAIEEAFEVFEVEPIATEEAFEVFEVEPIVVEEALEAFEVEPIAIEEAFEVFEVEPIVVEEAWEIGGVEAVEVVEPEIEVIEVEPVETEASGVEVIETERAGPERRRTPAKRRRQ